MSFLSNRFALPASLLFCLFLTLFASQTYATVKVGPSDTLSLRDAIAATLAQNPQLQSFQFREQALAGERQTAALKPAMRLSGDLENIAGSGDYRGVESAELTLALSSVIELGDKRDARLNVVSERQQALASQQRIVELDVLAEVTRRFIEVAAAQKYSELQKSTTALATQTTAAIKRRVEAGSTTDVELARAQANQARMAIGLRQAELNIESAKINLAALWGSTEPLFTTVQADLLTLGDAIPLDQLLKNLADNPDIVLFANEARVRDAELRLAASQRKTDVEWSAGVRRLQASNDSAVVLGVSVPLAGARRAAGEIATANANRLQVDSEREAAIIKLRAQLIGLYQTRQAAVFEVASLRSDIIPHLKKAVNGSQAAFDKGRYGYFELTSAQRELLEAEVALIDAAARAHILTTDIERLTGSALRTVAHSDDEVK